MIEQIETLGQSIPSQWTFMGKHFDIGSSQHNRSA